VTSTNVHLQKRSLRKRLQIQEWTKPETRGHHNDTSKTVTILNYPILFRSLMFSTIPLYVYSISSTSELGAARIFGSRSGGPKYFFFGTSNKGGPAKKTLHEIGVQKRVLPNIQMKHGIAPENIYSWLSYKNFHIKKKAEVKITYVTIL